MILEYLNKILSTRDPHEAESVYVKELTYLGKVLFNKNVNGCGNCLIEIFIRIHKNKEKLLEMAENKNKGTARFKEGIVRTFPGWGETISNANLTDEIAKKIIKLNKAYENLFETLPGETKANTDSEKLKKADVEIKALMEENEKLKKEIESLKSAKVEAKAVKVETKA